MAADLRWNPECLRHRELRSGSRLRIDTDHNQQQPRLVGHWPTRCRSAHSPRTRPPSASPPTPRFPQEALDEVREPIREIADRLGRIPLAVSMAGLYFRNTQGRLDELATQYFADLAALDDSFSVPRGFGNKTAFDAIRYAVENLGRRHQGAPSTRHTEIVIRRITVGPRTPALEPATARHRGSIAYQHYLAAQTGRGRGRVTPWCDSDLTDSDHRAQGHERRTGNHHACQ